MLARALRRAARGQRGLSLVELLVGVAIGLIIVAGAATTAATQLADTRRLTLEAQVQQDLRATTDIIARQVRRAGYWASAGASTVWSPGSTVTLNPAPAVTLVSPSEITIALSGSAVTGFKLNAGPPGVIVQKYGLNPAQALTDSATVNITGFNVQLAPIAAVQLSCAALCADGTNNCWPTLQPQELIISVTGQSLSDPNVVRTVQSTVRVRSDQIVNNNAGGPLCPA